jgi:hypothetical protein
MKNKYCKVLAPTRVFSFIVHLFVVSHKCHGLSPENMYAAFYSVYLRPVCLEKTESIASREEFRWMRSSFKMSQMTTFHRLDNE